MTGARPQPALIHQRQDAGVHHGRFAGTGIAVDLEPANGRGAGAAVKGRKRVQGLLLSSEEQPRLVRSVGVEPDKWTALEPGRRVGDDGTFADLVEQALGKGIGSVPRRPLEKPEEGRLKLILGKPDS